MKLNEKRKVNTSLFSVFRILTQLGIMSTCTRSPSYFISANIPFGHFLMAEAKDLQASANIGLTGVMTDALILNFLVNPGTSSTFFKQRSTTS